MVVDAGIIEKVVMLARDFVFSISSFAKEGIYFIIEHKEIIFFGAGGITGYRVGLFFGEDSAEDDVINYLSGKMKIE